MKYIILTRKSLTNIFLIAVAAVLVIILGTHMVSRAVNAGSNRKLPIYSVETDKKQVALSFDAAWGNEDTEQLIEIFSKYKIKVTFFVVGEWVDKFPESVKALHDAGHSIQNHSDKHPHMPKLSRDKMNKEIKDCNDKIEAVTGIRPTLHRPPYGDYDNALIEVLAQNNMYCIQWDVDSLDWKNKTAKEIQDIVLTKTQPGSIALFHNAAINTPASLPGIIEGLMAQGYEFVLIEDLILKENYIIDHTGKQIANPAASKAPAVSSSVSSSPAKDETKDDKGKDKKNSKESPSSKSNTSSKKGVNATVLFDSN